MPSRVALARFNKRVDSLLQGISDTVLPSEDRDFAIREAIEKYNDDAPQRTAVEFAGDAGAYYLLYGKAINIDEDDQDAGIDIDEGGTENYLAIQFTLDREMTIREWAFYLEKTGEPEGELLSEIWTDASDLPVTKMLAAESVQVNDPDGGPPEGWYDKVVFAMGTAKKLPAGTYHAVIYTSGYTYMDGTTEIIMGVDQSDVTNTVSVSSDGSSWAAFGTPSAGILEVIASTPGWRSMLGIPSGVEYPAADISGNEAPNDLEDEDYTTKMTADGLFLYFPLHRPSATELVRVKVAQAYEWQEQPVPTIDVPVEHFEAISYLSASLCCQRVASLFSQKRAPTIGADVADRGQQADRYFRLEKRYLAFYNEKLGLGKAKDMSTKASMTVMDMDLDPPQGGDFLFHRRRNR